MKKLSLQLLCHIYLLVALLVTTILSPFPYLLLALLLLLATLFITFYPQPPRVNIVAMVATIFLLPLALAALMSLTMPLPLLVLPIITAIAILPVLYLLDGALRQNAPNVPFLPFKEGRLITVVSRTMFLMSTVMLLVSLLLDNRALLSASLILSLYLLASLYRALRAVSRQPLDISATWKRIIAHTTGDISLSAAAKADARLYCQITPVDSWVKISRQTLTLNSDKIELNLTVTPPLAGPTRPQLQASVIDSHGLIQVNQAVEAIELHVIPRARYAEWLAMKYLEQAGTGTSIFAAVPPIEVLIPRRGVEYLESRSYQPGDALKNIDWKHTLKLSQLITKEFTEASGQSAIIVANLSVSDAEAADKLAFNLITTALTLARQGTPTALAVYNRERVLLATALGDPKEALKQTILLTKDIVTTAGVIYQTLQPVNIRKLRRNITQLKQAKSLPAQQLLGILHFEYQALEQAAKSHPATLALFQVTRQVTPPALIIVVSAPNHDTEALAVTIERLSGRRFATINVAETIS